MHKNKLKEMLKEIAIGCALAIVGFMAWRGMNIMPIVILAGFGVALYFLADAKGLVKSFNKVNPGKLSKTVQFSDIGGQSSAINELTEALEFIRNHEQIKKLGIRPMKGLLLTGPPGTGKTLMAKAAATYTDSAFVATSGSEFIEMYAGVGAQRVRKLFKSARDSAAKLGKKCAIIFIDEIDVVGGKRGKNSSHMEYDQTLNQLLVEMDGMKTDDQIQTLIVAATNRVDMLDPALIRPGRFDRQVKVDLPDKEGRLQILQLHTRNKPLAEEVSLELIAKETFGFSGAHLESLTNEAAIYAMREGAEKIDYNHFKDAVDKVIMGEKLDRRPNPVELKRVAVHEAGHALLSELTNPGSVSSLTVTPRGGALGYLRQSPQDDTYLYTKEYLENQIAISLAGALSEEVFYGNRSTGSSNDFEQAVGRAKNIIHAGMSRLGVVSFEDLPDGMVHEVITEIVQEQEVRVKALIEEHKAKYEAIVNTLLEKEKITGEEFRAVLNFDQAA